MTAFGKVLVFVQFILGVLFTTWAILLYSQRIDWAPAKTLGGDPIEERQGKLKELADQIKDLAVTSDNVAAPRDVAEARWQAQTASLSQATKSREEYQAFYADQLSLAKSGEDTVGRKLESPVRQLVRNPDGSLKTDNDVKVRPPVTSFGEPVKSVEGYNQESAALQKKVEKAVEDLSKIVDEAALLTNEIAGTEDRFGLRRLLRDEIAYFRNCLDEMLFLEPLVNSRGSELDAVQRRKGQLTRRKTELEAAAAANR